MSPFRHSASSGSLAELEPGFPAAVLEVKSGEQPVCIRLQELGLVPGAPVEVLSRQGGMLIRVGDQRLCLGEELARNVEVMAI